MKFNARAYLEDYRKNRTAGYTIDQTILIVAIIAILITMIVATVGWNLINKSGGAKLAAQMRQVEDSIGRFFSTHGVQLHQGLAATMTPDTSVQALVNALDPAADYNSAVETELLENMLPGFSDDGTNVFHSFGGGATSFVQVQVNNPVAATGLNVTDEYYVVQFSDVSIEEAREADKVIDGEESSTVGRVVYIATGSDCLGTAFSGDAAGAAIASGVNTVNICYFANLVAK